MTEYKPVCPCCQSRHRQTKAGRTVYGNQRYQCQDCKRYYCEENRRSRYPVSLRQEALRLLADGMSLRQIARTLCVNHQTVINWVNTPGEQERDMPDSLETRIYRASRKDTPAPG